MAHVEYDGNVAMGSIEPAETLTVRAVFVTPLGANAEPLALASVDAVLLSELAHDLVGQ